MTLLVKHPITMFSDLFWNFFYMNIFYHDPIIFLTILRSWPLNKYYLPQCRSNFHNAKISTMSCSIRSSIFAAFRSQSCRERPATDSPVHESRDSPEPETHSANTHAQHTCAEKKKIFHINATDLQGGSFCTYYDLLKIAYK